MRSKCARNSYNKQAMKATKPKQTGASRKALAAPASSSGGGLQVPTEEEIRARAYVIYLARGGGHGRHREDWEQAERELRGQHRGH
mgnify:CR=1 FL=1